MNKAVFLDRDGTINVEKHYLYRKEEFEFLPGVIEALRMLQDAGYLLIIITNQSGIARGYYTEQDYQELTDYMLEALETEGIHITDVLYCPHHPQAKIERYRMLCQCRKPALGMFYRAQEKWNIDFSRSYAIGDKDRDCSICNAVECKGFHIVDKRQSSLEIEHVKQVYSLLEAARLIID